MSEFGRYRILISGRVQGVGYRFFVIEEAEQLGLLGWVRNLADGRVESEVQGPSSDVETLVGRLKAGPRLARVDNVIIERLDGTVTYNGFGIR